MSPIKNVAVAGATGAVGTPLVQELLNAGFTVTALTRPDSKSTLPSSVKVSKVNYDDVDNLKTALQGQDALISTVSTFSIEQQFKLIDAAIAAGVKRLIPSEFGSDLSSSPARDLPVFAPKIQVQNDIKEKSKGTDTTYTFIYNNLFLDWAIDFGFGLNLKEKKMEIVDGGDKPYTTTPIPLVAKGTVAVLQHPDETANKEIRLHGTAITQNKLLEIAQRVSGKDGWEVTHVDSAEEEKKSYGLLQKDPSNAWAWVPGFLKRAIYADGYGGLFTEKNDNEMLGLKELSEKEVEEYVRSKA